MNKKLPFTSISEIDKLDFFEDFLSNGLDLRVKVTGKSMVPFLQGGEILTLKKVRHTSLRKGDLIFCKNRYGFPVLHRFIRKKRINQSLNVFQTKGDAAFIPDEPVSEHDVLGKVYKIEKILSSGKTKHINMESPLWKTINYMLAIFSSVQSRMHLALTYIAVRR